MIQKAIDYLINLGVKANPIVEVGDKSYSTEKLFPIMETGPDALELNFLDSLVTYIKENVDALRPVNDLIIEIS